MVGITICNTNLVNKTKLSITFKSLNKEYIILPTKSYLLDKDIICSISTKQQEVNIQAFTFDITDKDITMIEKDNTICLTSQGKEILRFLTPIQNSITPF